MFDISAKLDDSMTLCFMAYSKVSGREKTMADTVIFHLDLNTSAGVTAAAVLIYLVSRTNVNDRVSTIGDIKVIDDGTIGMLFVDLRNFTVFHCGKTEQFRFYCKTFEGTADYRKITNKVLDMLCLDDFPDDNDTVRNLAISYTLLGAAFPDCFTVSRIPRSSVVSSIQEVSKHPTAYVVRRREEPVFCVAADPDSCSISIYWITRGTQDGYELIIKRTGHDIPCGVNKLVAYMNSNNLESADAIITELNRLFVMADDKEWYNKLMPRIGDLRS